MKRQKEEKGGMIARPTSSKGALWSVRMLSRFFGRASQEVAIAAPRQHAGIAHQPSHPRPQGIGRSIPLACDMIASEQADTDIAMGCTLDQGVMDLQQQKRARHARLAGIEARAEPAMGRKIEEAPERAQRSACCNHPLKMKMGAQGRRHGKAALDNVEPDAAKAVGKKKMFPVTYPVTQGYRRGPSRGIEGVRVPGAGRAQGEREDFGIKIGMPEDPRVRGLDVGMFGENEAPIVAGWPVHACWRAHRRTRRYNRCRGAAIPT